MMSDWAISGSMGVMFLLDLLLSLALFVSSVAHSKLLHQGGCSCVQ